MTLTGYPPEDLVLRESFAHASQHAVPELASTLAEQGLGEVAVVIGYLAHTEGSGPAPVDTMPTDVDDRPGDANPRRGAPRNAAALLYGGKVIARYYKRHLPTTASSTRRAISCRAPSCRSCGCTASTSR